MSLSWLIIWGARSAKDWPRRRRNVCRSDSSHFVFTWCEAVGASENQRPAGTHRQWKRTSGPAVRSVEGTTFQIERKFARMDWYHRSFGDACGPQRWNSDVSSQSFLPVRQWIMLQKCFSLDQLSTLFWHLSSKPLVLETKNSLGGKSKHLLILFFLMWHCVESAIN